MDRRRDYRFRSRNRRIDEEVDAVAVALTVQIIICIILLIAAGTAKKINQEKYGQFKQEFIHLVNDTSEAAGRLFSGAGRYQPSFLPRWKIFCAGCLGWRFSGTNTCSSAFSRSRELWLQLSGASRNLYRQVPFAMGGNLTQQMEAPDETHWLGLSPGSARPPIAGRSPLPLPIGFIL